MELNREQIIKALECCKSFRDFYACDECPYSHTMLADDESCTNRMSQDALSLIKELTAENKLLNVELGNAGSEILRLIDREKELTEENEWLRSDVAKEFTCVFGTPHKVSDCPIIDEIAKAKADTVRKMQERLKEKMNDLSRRDGIFGTYYLVSKSFIDQIAKEMLEGEK